MCGLVLTKTYMWVSVRCFYCRVLRVLRLLEPRMKLLLFLGAWAESNVPPPSLGTILSCLTCFTIKSQNLEQKYENIVLPQINSLIGLILMCYIKVVPPPSAICLYSKILHHNSKLKSNYTYEESGPYLDLTDLYETQATSGVHENIPC